MKKHLLFFFFGLLFFSSSAQIVPTGNLRILEIIDNSADTFSFVGRFSDFKRRDLPTDVNVGDIVSVDSAGILHRHVITSVNSQSSSSSSSLNIETVCESCPNISIGVFQVSRGIGNEKITPASAGIDDTLRELIEADNITKIINLINNPAPVDWSNLQNVPAGFSDNIDDTSDADSDPTNELQTMSRTGNDATLSGSNSEVDVSDDKTYEYITVGSDLLVNIAGQIRSGRKPEIHRNGVPQTVGSASRDVSVSGQSIIANQRDWVQGDRVTVIYIAD